MSESSEVKGEVLLHKFIWSPDHLDENGEVSPSAFRKSELSGSPQHVSVQSMDIACRAFIEPTIERQRLKSGQGDLVRETAYSGFMECAEVRASVIDEVTTVFGVARVPEDFDPSHCGIFNETGKTGKAFLLKLRAQLVKLTRNIVPFDEVFPK